MRRRISMALAAVFATSACNNEVTPTYPWNGKGGATLLLDDGSINDEGNGISLDQKSPIKPNQPLSGKVSWTGAPRGASIMISIERDPKANKRNLYLGGIGPLLIHTATIGAKGTFKFQWSGKGFGENPGGIPEIIPIGLKPGMYVLQADIYDRTSFNHLKTLERPVRTYRSKAFLVTGNIDHEYVARRASSAVIEHLTLTPGSGVTRSDYVWKKFSASAVFKNNSLGRSTYLVTVSGIVNLRLNATIDNESILDSYGHRRLEGARWDISFIEGDNS